MNLSEMRSRLRIDLHDEDSANNRWTDNQLDRHLGRAVRELSAAQPRPDVATIQTGSDGRTVSLASLADLVRVEAVEYPRGRKPAFLRRLRPQRPRPHPVGGGGARGRRIGEGVLRTPSYPERHRLRPSRPTWKNWSSPAPPATPQWTGPATPSTASTWAARRRGGTSWCGGRRSWPTFDRGWRTSADGRPCGCGGCIAPSISPPVGPSAGATSALSFADAAGGADEPPSPTRS